jgi:transcriptional regulator with XRE-family HTH domain
VNTTQDRIRYIIEISGYSLRGFAKESGISPSGLSGILSGKTRDVSPMFLKILEIRFQVNPDWLRTGEGKIFLSKLMVEDKTEVEFLRKIRALGRDEKKSIYLMAEALFQNSVNDLVAEKNRKKSKHWQ